MDNDHPTHLNGCGACPAPHQTKDPDQMTSNDYKALAQALESFRLRSRIHWFASGLTYLELCDDHWAELRRSMTNRNLQEWD